MSTSAAQNGVTSPLIPMPGAGGTSNGNVPVGTAPTPGTVLNPNTAVANNPYATPVSGGSIPLNPLPPGTVQQNPFQSNTNTGAGGSYTTQGDFDQTYGQGTGNSIISVLNNLGTTNDAAIQATINNTNLEASKQIGNIQASEAAAGITPNSSTAALASGDFYSSVNSQLQSTVAGMEQNQENTLLQTLLTEGQAHGSDPTLLQTIGSDLSGALGIVGGGASAASGIVSAVDPSADTSILDALGALA